MQSRSLHDGREDGLVPLEAIRLDDVASFSQLVRSMAKTAFSGRQLGEALEILLAMFRAPSCRVVLTISGAMTVAKQGQIIRDLIDRRLVQAVVATGALIAHGLTESIGLTHYRFDPSVSDEKLFARGYNRIYDTLEMEANLNDVAQLVSSVLSEVTPDNGVWSSARICGELGRRLSSMDEGPGILRSAFERDVPVFIPAFTDSEMGLDVATWCINKVMKTKRPVDWDVSADDTEHVLRDVPAFNPFLDLQQYARLAAQSAELGILTIGGGVPRNWAQQVGPYIDVINQRVGTRIRPPRFRYGVRVCPEPVHWGGLSGCTYSEGVSWGKFVPRAEGGRFAEVYADATLVLPLLIKAVFEELDREAQ